MTCPQIGKAAEKAYRLFGETNYSYGLGVRCPLPGGRACDYGWGGAAGAYLAVIPTAEASFFYVQHVLTAPTRQLRKTLPEAVLADIGRPE